MQSGVVDIGSDIPNKPEDTESSVSVEEDLPAETRKRGTETLTSTEINFRYAIRRSRFWNRHNPKTEASS